VLSSLIPSLSGSVSRFGEDTRLKNETTPALPFFECVPKHLWQNTILPPSAHYSTEKKGKMMLGRGS